FVCPHCEARTTARRKDVDFFVNLRYPGPARRYYCDSCAAELDVSGAPAKVSASAAPATEAPAAGPDDGKKNNAMGLASFVLGLASIFLYLIGIVPLLAVVFGGWGLASFDQASQKNKWMAWVGLALGVVYTVMS